MDVRVIGKNVKVRSARTKGTVCVYSLCNWTEPEQHMHGAEGGEGIFGTGPVPAFIQLLNISSCLGLVIKMFCGVFREFFSQNLNFWNKIVCLNKHELSRKEQGNLDFWMDLLRRFNLDFIVSNLDAIEN